MKEEINQLIRYRMERAKEAIAEAELLFSEGRRASPTRLGLADYGYGCSLSQDR